MEETTQPLQQFCKYIPVRAKKFQVFGLCWIRSIVPISGVDYHKFVWRLCTRPLYQLAQWPCVRGPSHHFELFTIRSRNGLAAQRYEAYQQSYQIRGLVVAVTRCGPHANDWEAPRSSPEGSESHFECTQ